MSKSTKQLSQSVQTTLYKLISAFDPQHTSEKERQALSDTVDLIQELFNKVEELSDE